MTTTPTTTTTTAYDGKPNKLRDSSKYGKTFRKSVLGSNTLVLFMAPSVNDQPPITISRAHSGNLQECVPSPSKLFNMLKEVNRFMVKGAKLYESLKELRLCGWVSPFTLLLAGPAEDMKVIKKAWIKRYLKNPLGYFINDVGIVQDFVVELFPQSPFLSLKTALFDAVSNLNNQKIFPTKDHLREYLKKHYPELKLPEMKHVHDCLSRLIKERRLYHNGHGYFVISNNNVLNEVKLFTTPVSPSESTQIEGFVVSSSDKTTSSSPGITEGDVNSYALSNDISSTESGFPSCLENKRSETVTKNPVKNFFKKHTSKGGRKQDQNEHIGKKVNVHDKHVGVVDTNPKKSEKAETKYEYFDQFLVPGTKQERMKSPSTANREKQDKEFKTHADMPLCPTSKYNKRTEMNKHERLEVKSDENCQKVLGRRCDNKENNAENTLSFTPEYARRPHDFETVVKGNSKCIGGQVSSSDASSRGSCTNRKSRCTIKRSQSLDSIDNRTQREVAFAVVGFPCNATDDTESRHFKRSHSFGAVSRKNYNKQRNSNNYNEKGGNKDLLGSSRANTYASSLGSDSSPQVIQNEMTIGNNGLALNSTGDSTKSDNQAPDLILNYDSLGSSLSFHKNHLTEYTVKDLSSPPTSVSLAGEIKDVSNSKTDGHTEIRTELDDTLFSPHSHKDIGVNACGYNCNVLLEGDTLVGDRTGKEQVLINDCNELDVEKTNSSERRKRNEKHRTSSAFEERRSSLTMMGLV